MRAQPRALLIRLHASLPLLLPRNARKVPVNAAALARAAQIASAPANPPSDPGVCCVDVTNALFGGSKCATTVLFASIWNVHVSNPLHAPPQPPKPMFAAGVAVMVTLAWVATVTVPSALSVVPLGITRTEPP